MRNDLSVIAINRAVNVVNVAGVATCVAKLQGIATLRSALNNLRINKKPLGYIVSGFCLLIAAFFLILPGFMTDILGFLLLIPFTRKFILENFFTRTQENESDIGSGSVSYSKVIGKHFLIVMK